MSESPIPTENAAISVVARELLRHLRPIQKAQQEICNYLSSLWIGAHKRLSAEYSWPGQFRWKSELREERDLRAPHSGVNDPSRVTGLTLRPTSVPASIPNKVLADLLKDSFRILVFDGRVAVADDTLCATLEIGLDNRDARKTFNSFVPVDNRKVFLKDLEAIQGLKSVRPPSATRHDTATIVTVLQELQFKALDEEVEIFLKGLNQILINCEKLIEESRSRDE
jgi:hypothetical protein